MATQTAHAACDALLGHHEERLQTLEASVHTLGISNATTAAYQKAMTKQVERLDERMGRMEENLNERIESSIDKAVEKIGQHIDKRVDEVNAKVEKLDAKVDANDTRLNKLEDKREESREYKAFQRKLVTIVVSALAGAAIPAVVKWLLLLIGI